MRRLLLITAMLVAASAAAQDVTQTVLLSNGTPTGSCAARKLDIDLTNSLLYFCSNGSWVLTGTGSSVGFPQFGNYTLSVSGGVVSARNNSTGAVDYSGSDAAVVVNNVLGALASTGGRLYFKNGVYPISSATAETNSGCTNYYAIGIPANAEGSWATFIFEGESRTPVETSTTASVINTDGVILNVTAAAVTAAGSSMLAGIWQRPNAGASSCNVTYPTYSSNEDYFKNITVRFPTNQRGNECAFCMWAATTTSYENVVADFNLSINAIATGSAPVAGSAGSFGITSSYSGNDNLQDFKNTVAVGYDTDYDFESEHVTGTTVTAMLGNYAAKIGRTVGSIYHPIVLNHFIDQENLHGFLLGTQMQQGSRIDILGLDIEVSGSGWYARSNGGMSETNSGFTNGLITETFVKANVGLLPDPSPFTSGGSGFVVQQSGLPMGTAMSRTITSFTDNFTRANASTLGPAWIAGTQGGNTGLLISSNHATPNTGTNRVGYQTVTGSFSNDQFSRLTVGAITSGGWIDADARASTSVQTYYAMQCIHTNGGIALNKVVAGSQTTLASNAQNCSAGDQIEVDAIGSTIIGYYIPSGSIAPSVVLAATDTAIASGAPQINIFSDGSQTNYVTSATGGSLPYGSAGSSLFNQSNVWAQPQYFPGLKSNSGTRYACFDTSGQLVSSASACSGT